MADRVRAGRIAVVPVLLAAALAACSQTPRPATTATQGETPRQGGYYKVGVPYQIFGVWYYPAEDYQYAETGIASFYGGETQGVNFHGRLTANGEIYDMNALTAAHQTLPMPSLVRVTNLDNGRQMVLRINDRGPFVRGRIIDVSRRSAQLLGFEQIGTAKVRVEVLPEESRAIKVAMLSGQAPAQVQVASLPRPGVTTDALPAPAAPVPRPPQVAAVTPPPSLIQPAPLPPLPPVAPVAPPPLVLTPPPPRPSAGIDVAPLAPLPGGRPAAPVFAPPPAPTAPPAVAGLPVPPPARPPISREVAALPVEQQVRLTPVIRQTRVQSSNIYISAGAYSNYDQAFRLSTRLSRIGPAKVESVRFGQQQLFRVKIGPIASVPQADLLYDQVTAIVPDARITVE